MNKKIIPLNSTIIVGFSGGPDSIYLLEKLCKMQHEFNLTIIAAHLDHEWRVESAKDALWCQNYCNQKQIPFVSKKISELALEKPSTGSQEAAARIYRRFFLQSIAQDYPHALIALGHHRDDQIETFFIRLARGTTVAGLGCMKQQSENYIRPLLEISKKEILGFLKQQNIPFLIDSTNINQAFLRNHIRAKLTSQLDEIDSRFIKNIEKTITHLQQTYKTFQDLVKSEQEKITQNGHILTEEFLKLQDPIKHEIISKMFIKERCEVTQSNSLFKEIIRFLQNGKQQKHLVHPTCQVVKQKDFFEIINPNLTA